MGTEQKVTREEAIRMYTINGAYHTFEEDIKGNIEPGKLADLIIIDRDILTYPLDEIKNTKVLITFLRREGRLQGQANNFLCLSGEEVGAHIDACFGPPFLLLKPRFEAITLDLSEAF